MDPTSPPPPRPLRPLARILLVLGACLLALGILAGVLGGLGPDGRAGGLLTRLSWAPLLGSVLAWILASLLAGPRLRAALPAAERERAPSSLRLGGLMIGVHALNLALPGPAGDLALIGLLARGGGLPPRSLIAATTWTRVWGLATIALGGLVLLPLAPRHGLLSAALVAVLGLLALGGAGLALLALAPGPLSRLSAASLGAWGGRLPGPIGGLLRAVDRGVAGLSRGLADVARAGPRLVVTTLAWSALIQVSLLTSLGLAAAALGQALAPLALALCHVTAELASVAVAVAPAGVGGFDGALAAALVGFADRSPWEAAALVLVVRLVQALALGTGTVAVAALAPGLLDAPVGTRPTPRTDNISG